MMGKKKQMNGNGSIQLDVPDETKTIAVSCRQWGDTGKGKIVDLLTGWAEVIVRSTGGDNAGHTICTDGRTFIAHLIPSGIIGDSDGKINIMSSGMVIYPRSLIMELANLRSLGMSYDNLFLSCRAKLITPAEIVFDRISEVVAGSGRIGSTGRGIGPCYTDEVARYGLTVNDLLNPVFFRAKLARHLEYYTRILRFYDWEDIKTILYHEHLESGLYYDEKSIFNFNTISRKYLEYGRELQPLIRDTDSIIQSKLGIRRILLEGAQGDLLSVKRGTYPFVTSSDCTVAGMAAGAGIEESDIDLSLGIIKGFYMTRVGGGPFPTEYGGKQSEEWCNGGQVTRTREEKILAWVNDLDEFLRGIAIRQVGSEYGATTKRPRRTGRLDLPLLRYVLGFNSRDIVMTKLDVLDDCEEIEICDHYVYTGPNFYNGQELIETGSVMHVAIPAAEFLQYCQPVYVKFPVWKSNLRTCHRAADLPAELKSIINFLEDGLGIKVRIISVGPDRQETVFL